MIWLHVRDILIRRVSLCFLKKSVKPSYYIFKKYNKLHFDAIIVKLINFNLNRSKINQNIPKPERKKKQINWQTINPKYTQFPSYWEKIIILHIKTKQLFKYNIEAYNSIKFDFFVILRIKHISKIKIYKSLPRLHLIPFSLVSIFQHKTFR